MMRVLMLGNSFTHCNDLPGLLEKRLGDGAEVASVTRGGARLTEFLNPETASGEKTLRALKEERWDYVVLQEMSHGPITSPKSFRASVAGLVELIRANGAKPVLYATWAYRKDCDRLSGIQFTYEEMYRGMTEAYRAAAREYHALLAEVGTRFYELADPEALYADDAQHPSLKGSELAADTLAETILADCR